jgi:hypothetical protein
MRSETDLKLPKIGYLYHYPRLDHPSDKFRLDIFISSIPTEKHFDVLRVTLPVIKQDGGIEHLKIIHPWLHEKSFHLCAGVVIMEDRKGKKEEAFSFGGEIKILSEEDQTQCFLVSSAPILEINGALPLNELFIEELEIILAEQRAAHGPGSSFEANLCAASPESLYLACLRELRSKLKQSQHKNELDFQLLSYLDAEEHRLFAAGITQMQEVTLEDIFGK